MSDSKKDKAVKDYNSGKIDVLLLSSSGGEGLDLKNTRQIHIMEPHWNTAKINQVIGRGIRYMSHIDLPKTQQNVNVYYWISEPHNKKGKMGTDEYLYSLSENKINEMEEFLKTIKKMSIENNELK
jgi:SNF2 family DNA or RNA helicase